MPHIISDQEHRANQEMKAYLNDPAPLPMPFEDDDDVDMRASCGLLENDGWYPEEAEDENWSK